MKLKAENVNEAKGRRRNRNEIAISKHASLIRSCSYLNNMIANKSKISEINNSKVIYTEA